MIPPPVQLVVNRHAGNGQGLVAARRLERILSARGHVTRTLVVEGIVQAARWAAACPGGFGYLFCIGGDSTINAVAPAAMRLSVPLVPVPTGFGNTFARALGHHGRRRAWRLLDEGVVRWVDVGLTPEEVFIVCRTLGLLEQVEQAAEAEARRAASPALRYLAYLRAAARILRDTPLPAIQVEVDGERVEEDAALVIVANVPTYRGFLNMTPSARPEDGLLDILVVPRTTKRRLVSLLAAFLLHLPGRHHRVLSRQGTRVSLRADGRAPEELRILPAALPVLAPR